MIKTEFEKIQSEWKSLKKPSYYLQQNQDPYTIYEKKTSDCLNHVFEFIWNLKDETDPLIFKCIRECFTDFASIIILFRKHFSKEILDKKTNIQTLIRQKILLFRVNRFYSSNSSPFTLYTDHFCPNCRIDIQISNEDQKFLRFIPFKFLTFDNLGDVKEICQRYDETSFSDEEEKHLKHLAFEFSITSLYHVVFLKATSCKFLEYFLAKYFTSYCFGKGGYNAFISLKNEKEILKKFEIFGYHLKLVLSNTKDFCEKTSKIYELFKIYFYFSQQQKPNFHQIRNRELAGKPFRLLPSPSLLHSFIPEEFLKDHKDGFKKIRNTFVEVCGNCTQLVLLHFAFAQILINSLNQEQPSNLYVKNCKNLFESFFEKEDCTVFFQNSFKDTLYKLIEQISDSSLSAEHQKRLKSALEEILFSISKFMEAESIVQLFDEVAALYETSIKSKKN